ncbi:hypothetical protein [Nostoc sp. UHCC 0251]|uniref:hypothetical protein n=1 Tax=Nostoc sp. UHCC 0251 TaxID=3110240 RepID=UPI002B1EC13B|nr:hypothetical protein [Nostoc sp. UHCC 0251]MEA5624975.1 hypothetical protein [Nostoc sp. UHCC 0251]
MRNNLELMLIESAKLSKNNICIITGNAPNLFPKINNVLLRTFFKVITLVINHIDLGRKINKAKDKDAVIVYSFSTEFLFFSFLVSFWTKNVYLVNNHNIQQAYENPFMNLMLKIYHYLGYKFIILETSSVLMDLGYEKQDLKRHISLPHSVVSSVNIANKSDWFNTEEIGKKKVGIIGESRRGKNFSNTLDLILKIAKKLDILLIIGTDNFSCFEDMDLQGIKLIDTSTNDAYMAALSACDVVVLNYEKSKYFYRCSGVAADAIGVQTYVVCPDFPFMSSQVNYPAKVGVVYQDETDLEIALQQALALNIHSDNSTFESHYIERSLAKTASILDQAIQANS